MRTRNLTVDDDRDTRSLLQGLPRSNPAELRDDDCDGHPAARFPRAHEAPESRQETVTVVANG